jgi:CheY-like chemotaxis protein
MAGNVLLMKEVKMMPSTRMLIVEDTPLVAAAVIRTVRQSWGASVDIKVARNGREGLLKSLTYLPDVIITDMEMPEMHGGEMVRLIRQKQAGRDIPIIGMSECDLSEAMILDNLGLFDAFMIKPFSRTELRDKLMILCPALVPAPQRPSSTFPNILTGQSILLSL